MSTEKKHKKQRFNGLDVTIILLAILVILGIAGRIVLDRVNSRDVVTKNVSFTCILPKDDLSIVSIGNVLFDANDEAVGGISEIYKTTLITDTVGDTEENYYRVTGVLLVEGYETKDGVFYTMGGQEMRINTVFPLGYGDNVSFYLDDIVENGQ